MRRSTPSWVAASPTPSPSRMIAIIRSTSTRSSAPKSATGEALLFNTGSPNLRILASAASRRSNSSTSSCSRSVSSLTAPSSLTLAIVWIGPGLLRVDVNADRDVFERTVGGQALDRGADRGDRCFAILGLGQEAAPVPVADAEHRRRAKQVGVGGQGLGEGCGQHPSRPLEAPLRLPLWHKPDPKGETGVGEGPSAPDLPGEGGGG